MDFALKSLRVRRVEGLSPGQLSTAFASTVPSANAFS